MKLRLKHNSIRLRLAQNEVAHFAETGRVEETIEFGLVDSDKLVFALESNARTAMITAKFENRRITVFVPKKQADEWTANTQVGMENASSIGDGKILRLLIEKDFACLEPRSGEDDKDAFPHPLEGKVC